MADNESAIAELESLKDRYCFRIEWKIARPLWPCKCIATGKWLWLRKAHKVRYTYFVPIPVIFTQTRWLQFEAGIIVKLMCDA